MCLASVLCLLDTLKLFDMDPRRGNVFGLSDFVG
jgi:hypothetical protein